MDDWSLVYDGYRPEQQGLREALCTLGNGLFATRGAAPDVDADAVHYPGTYLAGGYDRLRSTVGGREVENEDLVNLPNWLALRWRIDGGDGHGAAAVDDDSACRFDRMQILSYCQQLDLRRGLLQRELRLRDAAGRTTRWRERRLVSMAEPQLAALSVEFTAEDWSGRLLLHSALDGSVVNAGVARYRALDGRHLEILDLDEPAPDTVALRARLRQSRLELVQAARTRVYRDGDEADAERRCQRGPARIGQRIGCALQRGQSLTLEKVVALQSSRDRAVSEPGLAAREAVARAGRFDELLDAHALAWSQRWQDCDIGIDAAAAPQTALKLRLHVFHLLQTASPHSVDLDAGIPARGWHGEAYRGHVFWDELFAFPFVGLRMPTVARALLLYRYRRLDAARRAARAAGFDGAMFPWQSGSDGREESQRLHLNPASGRWIADNTWRQRHINAAIAYNVWQYDQLSDDRQFLHAYGAEMIFEIARFWSSVARHDAAIDRYVIRGVMGPDEFHTAYPGADAESAGGIDDNAYTNVMAAWVLTRACDLFDRLPALQCRQLCERLALRPDEIERWRDVARKLRVPFHDGDLISQFDGYAELDEFDWDGYRRRYGDIHRVDRLLEAEGDSPNRYKMSKQADVLMLFYLFSAPELVLLFEQLGYPFDPASIPRNVDYYLARTTHGSTLSRVAHAWVLARSDRPRSWRLFQQALDSDIADVQGGTTPEGIHVGAMAGSIDLVQRCYLGIEMRADVLHFDPALPDDLRRVRLRLRYRHQVLDVEVDHERLRIRSVAATAPVTLAYRGHYREMMPGDDCLFRLLRPEARDRDENRPGRTAAGPA